MYPYNERRHTYIDDHQSLNVVNYVRWPNTPSREGRAAYGDTCSVGGGPSVHTADKAPCADVPPTRARDDPPPAAPGGREKAESGERNAASEKRAREAPLVTRSKQRTIPVVYDIGRLRRSARTSKTPDHWRGFGPDSFSTSWR